MPRIYRKLFLFAIAVLFGSVAIAQQDCSSAINVCSSTYTQSTSYVGVGAQQEIPNGSSCLGNGEVNSVWYTFTANSNGNLLFQLNPLSPGDDYDFAIYSMTNDSCSGIAAGTNTPVSCNYSSTTGATGLSSGGSGNNNGSSGPNQNAPLSAQAGESFVLVISNFTASQSGYDLNFSGSASIVDTYAGVIDSISLQGQCNPNRIRIYLTEYINCSSIASNGSDFNVTGPTNLNIVSANAIGCSGGLTNQLWLTFSGNIPTTGTYTVTIGTGSDGNTFTDGCGNEVAIGTNDQFQIQYIGPTVSINNVVSSDCGLDNGSANAVVTGGTPPYTFNWNSSPSQNTQTASNLEPRVYRVEVRDANGCKTREFVTIDNNNPIDVSNTSSTGVTCNGASNGSASINPAGGVPPFTIEWQTNPIQTGNNANNLPGGNVDVIVTDATGCDEEVTINIPQPAAINLPTSIVNPDCGVANGQATVSPTGGNGGFTYSWNTNPVQTTNVATNLSAGVYNVQVVDVNGCSNSVSVILADNFAPNATISSSTPDCGQGVGEATAQATSGVAPYTYSWSTTPPQAGATATGLMEGDYYVTVTDANGCVQIINVKIDSIPPPAISLSLTPADCGQTNGEASASVTDGTAPYSYSWSSSGNTTATEVGLSEGSYSITVTDDAGCTTTEDFSLSQLPPISDFTFNNACLGDPVSFNIQSNSGATSWMWDYGNGAVSDLENPTYIYGQSGDFEVTVILMGGCMNDTLTQTVSVFAPPSAEFLIDPEIVTTRVSANFINTGSGATSYLWNFGDGELSTEANPDHLYGVDGFYTATLEVTDANGCTDTSSLTFEVLLQPVIYVPNAFMPEGSPKNSRFKGYGIGVINAEMTIFNRWGSIVYRASSLNEVMNSGWDGNFNGKPARQGAYAYKLKADFYNNTSFEKLGTVTLIR